MNGKLILAKASLMLRQAGPGLLTGGGIILGIAALITACSKMKQTEAVNEALHEEVEEIQNGEHIDKKERTKAYIKAAAKAFWRYLKIFWIPIILELLSIIAIWYSHGIMVKRNASLASTAVILTQQIDNYRARVREKVGAEAENDLFYGLTNNKIGEQVETLENGKTKKTPIYEKSVMTGAEGPFDFIFDSTNPNYQRNPGSNMTFMGQVQRSCDSIMQSRAGTNSCGWYMMNEVFQQFGVKPTAESFRWGWRWDRNDPRKQDVIDFGINDFSNSVIRDFVNGKEAAIPLHFNCHPIDVFNDLGLMTL